MSARVPNLRLCMDARMLGPGASGVGTYARSLRAAQRSLDRESLLLTDRSSAGAADRGRLPRWLRALVPAPIRAVERRMADGAELRGHDIFRLAQVWFDVHRRLLPVHAEGPGGIMHWSYPVPLRLVGWSNVYTIHDVIPLNAPELSPIDPRRHGRLLRAIVHEATLGGAIATVSETARSDIVAALDCPPSLVTNCAQAVDRHDDLAVRLPGALREGHYLLVCGAVEPRKNVAAIVEAFARSGVDLPLVVAGPDPGGRDLIDPALFTRERIVRLPQVDAPTMTALLARARALLMPSRAEGFGLPVAEAMALGTPVLTSAGGALAETAGGAALLVDPDDIAAIAKAIRTVADDEPRRRELVARGRLNAERFTPDRFAGALSSLYAGLIAPGR